MSQPKKRLLKALLPAILLLAAFPTVQAQQVAVKTNLLYDATATVNLGVEIGLAPRWSLDVSGNFNGWSRTRSTRWKHWLVQPEARYWFCDRFAGHHVGVHLLGGQYNVGGLRNGIRFLGTDLSQLTDARFEGWFTGVGVAYGYTWILGRHWNMEAGLGVGYAYTRFDRYRCAGCGKKTATDIDHHYFGPTKAFVNLIYLF